MQAAPLVVSDVFFMSSLSIGVRSSAGVARGFWSEGVGKGAGAIEHYPHDSAHAECEGVFITQRSVTTPLSRIW